MLVPLEDTISHKLIHTNRGYYDIRVKLPPSTIHPNFGSRAASSMICSPGTDHDGRPT